MISRTVNGIAARAIVARANLALFERPDRLPRAMAAMRPWGTSTAGALAAAAARYPARIAVYDDEGSLTYGDAWRLARRVAAGLADEGVTAETKVGLLCRNHRGFLVWLAAVSAIGADAVLLNTGFAGPQLADVVAQEGIGYVIHDDEFADVVATCGAQTFDEAAMQALAGTVDQVAPRRQQGRIVVLTSGTTGKPKGAARTSDRASIEGVAAVLERIPFRLGDIQVVAAPLFHSWGLTNVMLGSGGVRPRCCHGASRPRPPCGRRRITTPRCSSWCRHAVADPRSAARRVRIGADATPASDRVEWIGAREQAGDGERSIGSARSSTTCTGRPRWRWRRSPRRPTSGCAVDRGPRRLRCERGDPRRPWRAGIRRVGRPRVRRRLDRFEGYTTGGGKEERRGLLSSGDLGHFDDGLLFIDGREDDMIVSGGENVFPDEIEELLRQHPAVADVAVVGVSDDEFGQALAAFVVLPNRQLSREDVRSYVRDNLARYKVPRVWSSSLNQLPRNATGKVLKRSLAENLPSKARSERPMSVLRTMSDRFIGPITTRSAQLSEPLLRNRVRLRRGSRDHLLRGFPAP